MTAFSMREFFARVMAIGRKHDHYNDFGYPETVTFEHLYKMYERNDLARAAVKKTTEKTFQNLPQVVLGEGDDQVEDEDVAAAFDRLGLWDKLADADEWAQVSGYSGIIFRLRDGKRLSEPVKGAFSLDDIAEIIPAWSVQLRVSEWHTDERDADNYGHPKMFNYNEAEINKEGVRRAVQIHPDRVVIWSSDGTVHAKSSLLSGYNNLLDMEKISGAGGEGFWKTAAARFNIEIDKGTDFSAFRQQVEAASGKTFQDALDEKVKKVNEGFDSSFVTQGMKVDTFSINLPQPKEFFEIPLMSYAAGRSMPMKILVGSQSGERASTEDANEWANTIMARRNRWTIPSVRAVLYRMDAFGVMPEGWEMQWDELSDDTPAKRLARADTMAGINQKSGFEVYDEADMRKESGHGERESLGQEGDNDV